MYYLEPNGAVFDLWVEGEQGKRAMLVGMVCQKPGEHEELCQRIVAALNFCLGLTTEQLLTGAEAGLW